MNPSDRDPYTPEPLTREERDLATRLSRLGPHGEPSAALDSRILRAAHAASGVRPVRHPRWPALLGLAATLVVAIGVTWQWQLAESPPRPASEPSPALAPAPASDAAEAAAPDLPDTQSEAPRARQQKPAQAPATPASPRGSDASVVADPPAQPPAAPAPPAPPPPVPPSASPPAAAAPAPPASAERLQAASRTATERAEQEARRRTQQENAAADASTLDSKESVSPPVSALPSDASEWPVQDDRHLPPDAWIERIRARHAAGDLGGARESLRSLVRSHPRQMLPPDLHELLEESQ